MISAMKTDIGLQRNANEDYCLSTKINNIYVYIVADGMGGHLAGEVASKLAVDSIYEYLNENIKQYDSLVKIIKDSLDYANGKIYKKSTDPAYKDMGTTIELVLVDGCNVYLGHVGDSRVYIKKNNKFKQITRDHSLINDLLESGSISESEADRMPQKNIITRALGGDIKLDSDIHEITISKGDIIFICTDGVTGCLDDEEIFDVLIEDIDIEDKAEKIIKLSNQAGGYDNSTIIIAEKR